MSVIFKGMWMPQDCDSCWIPGSLCPLWAKTDVGNRHQDCPLDELPEKHGRLIDADDMERFMSDTVQGDIRQYPYSDTLWDMAFKWIDSRPTIVEAEGE